MTILPPSLKLLSNNVVAYNLEDDEEHVTKPQAETLLKNIIGLRISSLITEKEVARDFFQQQLFFGIVISVIFGRCLMTVIEN
ncbi:hypothetical protein SDJN03_02470, partial [Cucurbita argyrosperma subsp. sororia]